jgi:hypothetical protein
MSLGSTTHGARVIIAVLALRPTPVATHGELQHFIEDDASSGRGIGHVDRHSLAAARLTRGARW